MNAKVKINLKEGSIELEGSEEFVSKYLELFEDKLLSYSSPAETPANENGEDQKSSGPKNSKKKVVDSNKKKKVSPKKIDLEEFDFEGNEENNVQSLKDFLGEKKVDDKSAPKFILAVGYYITNILKKDEFSEGNIEYAYRALGASNRPAHLHQIIINQKNNRHWFEEGIDGKNWKLSRIGEIFVESSLPEAEVNK